MIASLFSDLLTICTVHLYICYIISGAVFRYQLLIVSSLWNLLEDMQKDVDLEVQRVRRGIHETRMLVQAYREDSAARETARRERLARPRGRQMARG